MQVFEDLRRQRPRNFPHLISAVPRAPVAYVTAYTVDFGHLGLSVTSQWPVSGCQRLKVTQLKINPFHPQRVRNTIVSLWHEVSEFASTVGIEHGGNR